MKYIICLLNYYDHSLLTVILFIYLNKFYQEVSEASLLVRVAGPIALHFLCPDLC